MRRFRQLRGQSCFWVININIFASGLSVSGLSMQAGAMLEEEWSDEGSLTWRVLQALGALGIWSVHMLSQMFLGLCVMQNSAAGHPLAVVW